KRKARKSDEKINNSGRFWLPALLGGPALVVGAGMLFIHAAGWHEGQKMQQLQEIVADLHGDFAEVPGTQAKAAKVNAATKPPVSEQPEMDSIPPQAAFGAERSFPPAIADKRPSVEEQENGRTERAKSEELASVEKKKPAIIEENLPEGEEPLAAEKKEAAEGRDQRKEPAVGFNDPATGGAFIGGAGTAGPHNFIVNFALDSNELSRGSFQKLDRLARLLREHQELWAVVTGYTDTSGFYHYNKKISESRANMVKSYLVGRG
ncbi:MAG: OmpA family protein, partial [Deltaproteobacteria bacterium]